MAAMGLGGFQQLPSLTELSGLCFVSDLWAVFGEDFEKWTLVPKLETGGCLFMSAARRMALFLQCWEWHFPVTVLAAEVLVHLETVKSILLPVSSHYMCNVRGWNKMQSICRCAVTVLWSLSLPLSCNKASFTWEWIKTAWRRKVLAMYPRRSNFIIILKLDGKKNRFFKQILLLEPCQNAFIFMCTVLGRS